MAATHLFLVVVASLVADAIPLALAQDAASATTFIRYEGSPDATGEDLCTPISEYDRDSSLSDTRFVCYRAGVWLCGFFIQFVILIVRCAAGFHPQLSLLDPIE